jgi:hypothetical protein
MIAVFERMKIFPALDSAATVTDEKVFIGRNAFHDRI